MAMRRTVALLAVALAAALLATVFVVDASARNGREHRGVATATLRDLDGDRVGRVYFTRHRDGTNVSAVVRGLPAGYHGFHVHANSDPANGEDCDASTGFTSTDGHYNPGGVEHGMHAGDLPSLLVADNGRGTLHFNTDRLGLSELHGLAAIVHSGYDNYGNVPVGDADDQYTPNAPAATAATAATGNAGSRIACGVIKVRGARAAGVPTLAEVRIN